MTKDVISKTNRSGSLDLLRIIAVIAIFLGHYADSFNYVFRIVPENLKYSPVVRYSTVALTIFFMVSSYVITMTSLKRNIQDFVIIRLARIYPLFWVSCIVAFLLPRFYGEHSYLPTLPFKTLLMNMTMMPTVFGFQALSPVFHTLVVELCFYLFVLFILIFKGWNKILLIITVLLSLFAIGQFFPATRNAYFMFTPFIAGMLFYFINAKKFTPWKVYTLALVNFCFALKGSMLLTEDIDRYYKIPHSANYFVMGGIITLLYLTFLLISLKKINIPGYPFLKKLGEIAYPFFLFHIFFLGVYWHFRNTIQADILLWGLMIFIGLICWGLNVFVEKPLSKIVSLILVFIFNVFRKRDISVKSESLTHQF
ncbi:acyltransferase [Pedobacter sp. Leaf194]|uniref:acyltransferase family protein n=1 Tax=Pedobacter sp. Leaf194 TaxID=1736297 RepID=UPI0009E764D7|nr:acyltransferase [Pedobacter sp. Leaf194]